MKKYFIFYFSIFSFFVIFSSKAFAVDISASPSPVPDFYKYNTYNVSQIFQVPIYSQDGYIVGYYDMKFSGGYSQHPESDTQKTEVGCYFSFPEKFVINGVEIERELIEIGSIYSGDDYFYVPKISDINEDLGNGWIINGGLTSTVNTVECILRPCDYTNLYQYYFGVTLFSNYLRSEYMSSYHQVPLNGDPLNGSSTFASIISQIKYKNQLFLDYSRIEGYENREAFHGEYTSGGYGRTLTTLLYLPYNNDVEFIKPNFSIYLPFDYVELTNKDKLEDIKVSVDVLKHLNIDIHSLINQFSDLCIDIRNINASLLPSIISRLDTLISSVGGLNTKLDEIAKSDVTLLSEVSAVKNCLLRIENALGVLQDYSEGFNSMAHSLNMIQAVTDNIASMFSDFTEVSSEALEAYKESMQELESIGEKLDKLGEQLKAPLPDIDIDMTIDNILPSDFDMSVSWIKGFFDIPLISILCLSSFGLMLVSYVFFGKKG